MITTTLRGSRITGLAVGRSLGGLRHGNGRARFAPDSGG